MKTLKVNPEFSIELVLSVPYAYWLHLNNELKTVITSTGMKPFYYFCDDVKEEFTTRTIDTIAGGLGTFPNVWIHHNAKAITGKDYSELSKEEQQNVNGVLDYNQWICPPYKEYYKNNEFIFNDNNDKIIFISNKYNIEHNEPPAGFFDIQCLYDMFTYLTENGYTVIYKRPSNKEKGITIDQNEYNSIALGYNDIKADVEDMGVITDFELAKYFNNVILLDDIVKNSPYSYNETQLKVMANCNKFITVCGGNSVLSSLFGGTVISYVHKGKELRPNYFSNNSYLHKLSGANVIPVYDVMSHIVKENPYNYILNNTGKNDYTGLLKKIEEIFNAKTINNTTNDKIILNEIKDDNIIDKILLSMPDKFENRGTTSKKFKRDVYNFFNKEEFKDLICVEFGSYHGYTTRILSYLFKQVYGFNHNIIETNECYKNNADRLNIKMFVQDIYDVNLPLPINESDVFFIDAVHTYEGVLNDTLRALNMKSKGKKYIIYDDYGIEPQIKNVIQKLVSEDKLEILKFIGYNPAEKFTKYLYDYEGVICKEK